MGFFIVRLPLEHLQRALLPHAAACGVAHGALVVDRHRFGARLPQCATTSLSCRKRCTVEEQRRLALGEMLSTLQCVLTSW